MATVTYSFTSGSFAGTADGVIAGTDLTGNGLTVATNASLGYSTGSVLQLSGGTASLDQGKYVTVTLSNTAGGTWNLNSIILKAARGGSTNPRGFQVRTNLDGYVNNLAGGGAIGTVRPNWTTFTIDTSTLGALSGPLTVRIYQYAPATTASIEMDDITFTGAPVTGGTAYATDIAASSATTTSVTGRVGTPTTVAIASTSTTPLTFVAAGYSNVTVAATTTATSTQTVNVPASTIAASATSVTSASLINVHADLAAQSQSDLVSSAEVTAWLAAEFSSTTMVAAPAIDVSMGVNLALTTDTAALIDGVAVATDAAHFPNRSALDAATMARANDDASFTSATNSPFTTLVSTVDTGSFTAQTTLTATGGIGYTTFITIPNGSTLNVATTAPAGTDIEITIGPLTTQMAATLLPSTIRITSEASVARVVN